MATRFLQRKKTTSKSSLLDINFDGYTHVDNRERARVSD